jgi:hypothetical protein
MGLACHIAKVHSEVINDSFILISQSVSGVHDFEPRLKQLLVRLYLSYCRTRDYQSPFSLRTRGLR